MSVLADLKGLASKSVVYGAGSVLLRSISIFLLPLYTRFLTPADYGITGVVGSISTVLGFVMALSLNGAMTRFHFTATNEEERRRANGTIVIAMMAFALAVALLAEASGPSLARLYLHGIPFHPYVRIGIWTSLFNLLVLFPQIAFQVREKPLQYVALSVAGVLVNVAFLVWFVAVRREGALGYLKANLYAAILLAIPYVWITARYAALTFSKAVLLAALSYSVPLVPHQLGGWLLDVSDRLILQRYTPLHDVGLYSLGYQFGLIMYIAAMSINNAWIPFFFKRVDEQGDQAKPALARVVTYFVLVLCLIALTVAVLSREAMVLLVTPPFRAAYTIVPWITGAYLCAGLYFIPGNFVFATKHTRLVPIPTLAAGVANIIANLILVPRYGVMAACWTTFGAFALMLLIFWLLARKVFPFPYEYSRILAVLCSTALLFVVASMVSLPWIAAQIVVKSLIIVTLPALAFILCRSQSEQAAFERLLVRLRLRGAHSES